MFKDKYTKLLPATKQRKISDKLPRMYFVDQNIIRTDKNHLFGVLHLEGVHVTTESVETINHYDDLWHSVIASLDDNFGVMCHLMRRLVSADFNVKGSSQFTQALVTKYRSRYLKAHLYRNDLYITVLYKGLSNLTLENSVGVIQRLFSKNNKDDIEQKINIACGALKGKLEEILGVLGDVSKKNKQETQSFSARILDVDDQKQHSEILNYLGALVTGLEDISYCYPNDPLYGMKGMAQKTTTNLTNRFSKFVKFPFGNIGEFLANQEISFGRKRWLSFDENNKLANLLTVKQYGSMTTPVTFRNLLTVDSELLLTVSYFPLSKDKGLSMVNSARRKLIDSGDKAISQQEDIAYFEDDIASERVGVGSFHNSIMVLSKDKETLKNKTNEIIKLYAAEDFRCIPETFNVDAAFWAQFPGNIHKITRARVVSSRVFCHFFPMHNFPTGHTNRTHLGEALCLVDTPSKTPMFFNYHQKKSGSKNDFVPGHGFIVGANGFGKTTMMLFFDAMFEKYGARTFFFDRDCGAEIYFRATDNPYQVYRPSDAKNINQNPFSLADTEQNRIFLIDFMCALVIDEHETECPSEIKKDMTTLVHYAYDHVPASQRCLSTVVRLRLRHDFPRYDALEEWLRSTDGSRDGIYAEYFDNLTDDLEVGQVQKMGFDMTQLLSKPKLSSVMLMYIFHKIEQTIQEGSSKPTAIILDEGWFYLKSKIMSDWMSAKLATLRKGNAFLVLGTQVAESILDSPIKDTFLVNASFSILAPNPKAKWDTYSALNISHSQYEFIKNTPPTTRKALLKQDHEAAIFTLNLAGFEKEMAVLSGNSNTRVLMYQLIEKYGSKSSDWLTYFYQELGFDA